MKTVGFYAGKFLIPHQGHVYAMTVASTIVDELHVIVTYDSEYEKNILFKDSKVDYISYNQRVRWWKQITKDMSHVHVHAIEQKETGRFSDWIDGANKIKNIIKKDISHVFSSEYEYDDYFKDLYPDSEHVIIDAERSNYNISATKIRNEGIFKNWDMLPNEVKPYFVKRVVIVGTESAGKSTLVRNLAKLYNTEYVEEYGRTYFERLGDGAVDVSFGSDYAEIAATHKLKEKEKTKKANRVLFVDTEAIVTQYYSKLYLNRHDEIVEKISENQHYDLWLFLNSDVKWVDDGTRTFGEEGVRESNEKLLKNMLESHGVDYVEVSGSYLERLEKAVREVNKLMIFREGEKHGNYQS